MSILFLIVVIDLIGFGLIIPLLPFYGEHFDASPDMVGLLMATYSFTQFLAAPLWGRLSDRLGRRPVLLAGLAGSAAAYTWLGLADSLWALFAARAVGGAMAGNIGAAFAYAADVTTPADRAKGMGIIGAAFSLGFIAGPAIGGILAGPDPFNANYQAPAFTAAGLSVVALLLGLVLLKESLSPEVRARSAARPRRNRWAQLADALRQRDLGRLIGLSFLIVFVFAGVEATFAMWSRRQFGWGPLQNGYLFAGISVLSAVIQGGMVGRLARRFGEARLIVQGAAALAIGLLMIPFSTTLPVLIAATIVMGVGFSIVSPALNSLISLNTAQEEQGGVMGVTRSATTLARVVGPAWAGLLFAVFGKEWPYLAGAAITAAVVVLALRLRTPPSAPR